MTNTNILENTAEAEVQAKLVLLREDIRERLTRATANLAHNATQAFTFGEPGRLLEKAAAVSFVNEQVGAQLATVDSIEEAHTLVDVIETWGAAAVSPGFREGTKLVVGYINEYIH